MFQGPISFDQRAEIKKFRQIYTNSNHLIDDDSVCLSDSSCRRRLLERAIDFWGVVRIDGYSVHKLNIEIKSSPYSVDLRIKT